jgi:hypothetical protein
MPEIDDSGHKEKEERANYGKLNRYGSFGPMQKTKDMSFSFPGHKPPLF